MATNVSVYPMLTAISIQLFFLVRSKKKKITLRTVDVICTKTVCPDNLCDCFVHRELASIFTLLGDATFAVLAFFCNWRLNCLQAKTLLQQGLAKNGLWVNDKHVSPKEFQVARFEFIRLFCLMYDVYVCQGKIITPF